ncbi:MAG: ATP-binding protein [Bacteroidales bacterium]|nr:ATP-binding protein [Bacteroidales bacterium]MCM1414611.1 ATP-binding protein [bacterium]MCM1423876.1 ATP-binding protein [bacterium]
MGQETKKTTVKKGTELSQAKKALQQKDEELEAAKTAAEKAENARDIFLANMSHELRTPINTILGLNELIIRESQEETVKEYARDIRQAGNTLLALVSDILDFSKLEADKMELSEGIYDVSSLLNDLINSISVEQRRKKLELVLDIAQDIPYKLLGDEIHIRQIIGNLLSNAVRYTEKGKITLHLSWKKLTEDSIEIYVIVKDTGIGIKEKDIPKLFKAFQRMDSTVRGNDDRTGLGLAITYRLIEMMGGKLEVQSVYGKGSAFSFKIVQKVVDREPLGDFEKQYRESLRSIEDYHEKFIAPMGRILIVDDNAMNLAVAQGLLKGTRLQIDVASSGEECLELIKRKTYHLICMDHMMPVMDGVQTLHAIRSLTDNPSKDVPVIALTANAVAGARELYLKEGFQDYLTKPIDADKFENMLIEYLPDNVVYLTHNRKVSDEYEQAEEGSELAIRESQLYLMGFNLRNGLRYMGGDKALYGKVLHDFHSILQEKEEALKDFLQKGDMPGYTIIVHSLKGNARNVGADDLADEAFELEKMAKAGQLEDVTVRSPILFSMMKNMRDNLKVYLESEDGEKKQPDQAAGGTREKITEDEWVKALKELAERLDDFDGESAAEKLRELKQYDRPESDKKMLRLCEKAVKDYAYDIALEIVNAVL